MDVVNPFIKSNKARMVEFLDKLSVSSFNFLRFREEPRPHFYNNFFGF